MLTSIFNHCCALINLYMCACLCLAGGPMPGSSSCPYQPHPNKFKFTQVVNNRVMTQDCAPGTMFDISKCSCVTSTNNGPGPMPGSNRRREPAFGGKLHFTNK